MVKRLKAMLLLVLMLTSARFAKAETPKGEAHVSNKTNIETQAPAEDASLENDIIKTDEATKEEVIVAQEESEARIQARLQQICSKIDEVALAIENNEIKQMTNREYNARFEPIEQLINDKDQCFTPQFKNDIVNYFDLSILEILPDGIKGKLMNEYEKDTESFCYGISAVGDTVWQENNAAYRGKGDFYINQIAFYNDERCQELLQIVIEETVQACDEVKNGQIGGEHYNIVFALLEYAREKLGSTGLFVNITTTCGLPLQTSLFFDYIKKVYGDDYSNYFYDLGGIKEGIKLPEDNIAYRDYAHLLTSFIVEINFDIIDGVLYPTGRTY